MHLNQNPNDIGVIMLQGEIVTESTSFGLYRLVGQKNMLVFIVSDSIFAANYRSLVNAEFY